MSQAEPAGQIGLDTFAAKIKFGHAGSKPEQSYRALKKVMMMVTMTRFREFEYIYYNRFTRNGLIEYIYNNSRG